MTAKPDDPALRQKPTEISVAWITFWGTVLAATLGAAILVIGGWWKPGENAGPSTTQSDEAAPKLSIESIAPLPQRVNAKGFAGDQPDVGAFPPDIAETEFATFRFVVKNTGKAVAHLNRCTLSIDSVERVQGGVSTLALYDPIDHKGHTEAWIPKAEIGDVPVTLNVETVPAESGREFTIWFKSSEAPLNGALLLKARLRLEYDSQCRLTSDPFRIVIHSDSAEMHYLPIRRDGV